MFEKSILLLQMAEELFDDFGEDFDELDFFEENLNLRLTEH